MKKKGVSIVALWERASKANKRTSTSTPNPPDVEVQSSIIPPTIESNLQLALVQAHEPDDGHTEPESAAGSPTQLYNVNDQDKVRRRYIELGACQPKKHNFEYRDISGLQRRFSPSWFKDYKWLEYSVDKEAAFCFVCFLFKDKKRCPGGDDFVKKGFNNWNMKSRLKKHEGFAFRGHDESEDSLNKGNFLELLNWLAGNFEEVDRVVLKNAPRNCRMTHHDIQQEVIKCCAQETTKLVIEELDGGHFAILADESSDVYQNEQLAVCLRYVDKKGRAVVRFLGLAHVEDTTSLTLKAAIQKMLMDYNLTFAMVRGQGYDGASNMREIFGYTDELCRALQKQDEDIVHAIELVGDTKYYLEALRTDAGWDDFLTKVTSFCTKHKIKVVDMEGPYFSVGRPRRGLCNGVSNYHRFKVDMFVGVIDRQISELNGRFDEVNTELLSCMAAFCPLHLFAAYDQEKLVRLATKFYASDFTSDELARLPWQLNILHFLAPPLRVAHRRSRRKACVSDSGLLNRPGTGEGTSTQRCPRTPSGG
nr:zinc finger MYM-type protein 1-like [Aegilops tauschii subsp. strangulata]